MRAPARDHPERSLFFMKRKCMFMSFIDEALDPIRIPRFVKVRQNFPRPCVPDPAGELRTGLETGRYLDSVAPGMTVAITAGSRGITNYPLIIRTLVEAVKGAAASPLSSPLWAVTAAPPPKGRKTCWPASASPKKPWARRFAPPWKRCGSARRPTAAPSISTATPTRPTPSSSSTASSRTRISRRGGERHLQNVRYRHGQAERR